LYVKLNLILECQGERKEGLMRASMGSMHNIFTGAHKWEGAERRINRPCQGQGYTLTPGSSGNGKQFSET
jgi:hypothetical protein